MGPLECKLLILLIRLSDALIGEHASGQYEFEINFTCNS
jgi:hypothetical protein